MKTLILGSFVFAWLTSTGWAQEAESNPADGGIVKQRTKSSYLSGKQRRAHMDGLAALSERDSSAPISVKESRTNPLNSL